MNKKKLILLCAYTSLFSACESEDSSELEAFPFYQSLQVEYHVTQNKTRAAANFNKNNMQGANITLTGAASMLFNGKEPHYLNIAPYFYTYTFSLERRGFQIHTCKRRRIYKSCIHG